MHERQVKLGLSSVFHASAYGGQQQWTAGDGLSPGFRKGQSGIPAPPIVDQPHGAGGESATRQITGAVPAQPH